MNQSSAWCLWSKSRDWRVCLNVAFSKAYGLRMIFAKSGSKWLSSAMRGSAPKAKTLPASSKRSSMPARIGKAGASFRSLGDPLWDTSSSQGRLLSTLLAAIADFERDLIRERTGEGRKRAMAAGIKFGRPRKLSDYQRQEAIKRRADGETLAAISKSYGVSIAMISRL